MDTPCLGHCNLVALASMFTGFCRIFATELEDQRPKTVPYLEKVAE